MLLPGPRRSQIAAICVVLACGLLGCGGGGGLDFDPTEPTPTRITSADGQVIAVIPPGALSTEVTLQLENRSAADAQVPGPEGRSLVMAMELTAISEETPAEEPPAEEGGDNAASQADDGADDGTGTTAGEELVLSEAAEITFLLTSSLPASMSIPIYTFNESAARYEDAELSGTVDEDGARLVFSITRFGRYSFYSLLPEEIPPPAPGAIELVAASTQVRKLHWTTTIGGATTGLNLYRGEAGADSFSVVNSEPLTTVSTYVDELPGPGAYEYYLKAINSGGLESEAGPVLLSPAVDFDLLRSFGRDRLQAPGDLALSAAADLLLIADPGAQCVWVYNLAGEYQGRISTFQQDDLREPRGVAISPAGARIYVSDAYRARVLIYDTDFDEVGLFGARGSGPGEFERPTAVEVIYDDEVIGDIVLVVDEQLSSLQSFTGLGVYLDTLAVFGAEDGQLDTPGALHSVPAEAALYLSDSGNARVQLFNEDLEYDSVIELSLEDNGPFDQPLGVAVDFRGRLYVADSGNRRVVVLDDSGERLFHFGADGMLGVEFSETTGPSGLALDPTTGYLYVSDPGDQRIVIFTS